MILYIYATVLLLSVGQSTGTYVHAPLNDTLDIPMPIGDKPGNTVRHKRSAKSSGSELWYNGYADYDMSDWMASVPDGQSLALMSIPGTHDSAAKDSGCGDAFNTQQWTIEDQLKAGIRYFDGRLRHHGDGFYLHHENCYLNMAFGTLLNKIAAFFRSHPGETVLLRVKQEYSRVSDYEFIKRFNKYVDDGRRELIYQQYRVPTMREVRGKIVVISNVAGLKGIQWNSIDVQDDYAVWDLPGSKNAKSATVEGKLKEAVEVHRAGRDKLFMNHLSGGYHAFPYRIARWVNSDIYNYLRKDPLGSDYAHNAYSYYGILIMDYPGPVLVNQIIKQNANSRLKGSPIVTLYNEEYKGYLYAAESYADDARRHVLTANNGALPPQGYWLKYAVGDGGAFAYYNTYHKEFLSAGDGVTDKRRHTYAGLAAVLAPDAEWTHGRFADGQTYLRSVAHNGEYLYASSINHDSAQSQRTVWTWTDGTAVKQSGWKETRVGVY